MKNSMMAFSRRFASPPCHLPSKLKPLRRAPLARYFDVTFTVYPDRKTTEAAIAAGAMECNGKKCAECGYMCYRADGWTAGTDIAELLRGVNAADRKALVQACAG